MMERIKIDSCMIVCLSLLLACMDGKNHSVRLFEKEIVPHPRLLFTTQDEGRTDRFLKSEPLADSLRHGLLGEATRLLSAPLQTHVLRDVNYTKDMLGISREQVYRMITLSMAYRLTGDSRFAVRVEEELLNVCAFPDWNPMHYLDVAEMTTAVAIGYDWLYDVLSPDVKEQVVNAIKTKALELAVKEYVTGGKDSWAKRETNWNVVCNAGMTLGALAIAETYPELAEQVIAEAVKYTPNCLRHFAPDGVCYEGPSYWGYTNMYLSFLLKALDDNIGYDFGLSDMDGIKETVLYYIRSASPSGKIFNFANSGGVSPEAEPIYFYFSRKFNQPEAAAFYRRILSERLQTGSYPRCFFLAIPWYDAAAVSIEQTVPGLRVYKGINDIVVFNGDKNRPNSLYLTAKTGDPDMAHQQLDVGTFIVESNGVRWSDDLGADNYSLPGFWDYRPDGQRWHYFRNTNFSHNTLSVDNKIQHSGGAGEIEFYDEKDTQPFVVMNLSGVYEGQARFAYRTFRLLDDTRIRVTDSIGLNIPSQSVEWNMITSADVQCNGNRATLHKDGKTFFMEIESPADVIFTVRPARTFTPDEKPVTGYTVVSATVSGMTTQTLNILLAGE